MAKRPLRRGVTLSSEVILPSAGSGSLSGTTAITSFSAGVGSTSVAFSDVGIIELKAAVTDGNYLNAGTGPSTNAESVSGVVGRFYPSHFVLSGGALTQACTVDLDHSYLGQTFSASFSLTAVNTSGTTCANYAGNFAKLDSSTLLSSFVGFDTNSSTVLTSRLSTSAATFSWAGGVLTETYGLSVARASSPDGPFTQAKIGIAPADSDGVALQNAALDLDANNDTTNESQEVGQAWLRHGRLLLEDAHGPETANLPLNFLTQYWNGTTWVTNTADSCTEINLTDISFPDGTIDTVSNRTVTVGGGTSTGVYSSLGASTVQFTSGDAGHYFTAPGDTNTGTITVDVDITNYPWLAFDWDGDGNHGETTLPSAQFSFGSYRGHDRVLFWEEVLQ